MTAAGGWDSRHHAGPACAATEASADAGSRDQEPVERHLMREAISMQSDQEAPEQAVPDGGTGQANKSRSTTPLLPAAPVAAPAFVVPAWPSPTTTPLLPAVPGWPSPALPHLIVLGDAGMLIASVIIA